MLRDNAVTPSATFLDGVDTQVVNKLFNNVFTVKQQMPWAGGSYAAAWDGSRRTTITTGGLRTPAVYPCWRRALPASRREEIPVLLAPPGSGISDNGAVEACWDGDWPVPDTMSLSGSSGSPARYPQCCGPAGALSADPPGLRPPARPVSGLGASVGSTPPDWSASCRRCRTASSRTSSCAATGSGAWVGGTGLVLDFVDVED